MKYFVTADVFSGINSLLPGIFFLNSYWHEDVSFTMGLHIWQSLELLHRWQLTLPGQRWHCV